MCMPSMCEKLAFRISTYQRWSLPIYETSS
jgi:hypothetical protein